MMVGLLLALSAIGCGRKGSPKPLKPRAPVVWSAQTWGSAASLTVISGPQIALW
jgi:hypothetical protein